jgi:hypothetical protein
MLDHAARAGARFLYNARIHGVATGQGGTRFPAKCNASK